MPQPAKQVSFVVPPPSKAPVVETRVQKGGDSDYVAASITFNVPTSARATLGAFMQHLMAEGLPSGGLLPLDNGEPNPRDGRSGERYTNAVDGAERPSYVQIACLDLGTDAPNDKEVTRVDLEYRIMTVGGALRAADPGRAMDAAKRHLEIEEAKLASALVQFAGLKVDGAEGGVHEVS